LEHPGRRGSSEDGFTLIELMVVVVFIAVLAGIAVQAALYALEVARVGSTVGNMRGATTCLMEYEAVHSALPGGGLRTMSSIETLLRPLGFPVPTRDGWGHDLYYEPLVVAGNNSFRIYSYGKDGTPDGAVPGVWVDFYSDIVVESGSFIQTKW
jgi:prepilin-type N-terminal cleavage/methylation domain-containing protein